MIVNDLGAKSGIDWPAAIDELDERGFAVVSHTLSTEICDELIAGYDTPGLYRKTVVMERHRFGLGEYKYFDYPLPDLVRSIRESVYPKLAPLANIWMERLNLETRFPTDLGSLRDLCQKHGQTKATPLILKYGKGGFNTLHQDLYGEIYFPMQLAFFLNEPSADYTGGEFVMTEQAPRSQSKAIVLSPKKGDIIIFTTSFRPVRGVRGYYRATMRHGVSEILNGERHTLGVIFHDAES